MRDMIKKLCAGSPLPAALGHNQAPQCQQNSPCISLVDARAFHLLKTKVYPEVGGRCEGHPQQPGLTPQALAHHLCSRCKSLLPRATHPPLLPLPLQRHIRVCMLLLH